ncbi:MAG: hemerythrin domain-containing protein [Methanotrichaceae archaeon]
MGLKVPSSLKAEHKELHSELAKAIESGGDTGKAAEAVAEALHSHFLKEEEYALPELGILPALAEGKVSEDMRPAIDMANRLKADLGKMLQEHKAIVTALKHLSEAAKRENKPKAIHFSEKLAAHAQTEEEVLYPASILVGEYLKLKLQ